MHRMALPLTALVFASVLALVWLRLTSPYDGVRVDWTASGLSVSPWPGEISGLRRGDVIVAITGRSMASWVHDLASPGAWRQAGQPGQTVIYTVRRDGQRLEVPVTLRSYPRWTFLARTWSLLGSLLIVLLIGVVVSIKRPAEPAALALLLAATGLLGNSAYYFGRQVSDITGGAGFWLTSVSDVSYLLFSIALVHFWLVFPRPRPFVARRPRLIGLLYVAVFTSFLGIILVQRLCSTTTLIWLSRVGWPSGVLALACFGAASVAAVGAYRAASKPVDRRRIRWVTFGLLVSTASVGCVAILQTVVHVDAWLGWVQAPLLALPLPLAVAIAILRYHLFDIDVILSRTLIYGTLTAAVVGTYVLIVSGLGELFARPGHLAFSLIAVGPIAVLFQPLRDRLQRWVNRFVYGDRDDPATVVARLGQKLEATHAADAILPAIAETVAEALKLPYAAIALRQGDAIITAAVYGVPHGSLLTLPLIYQAEPIGQIALAPRSAGETFTAADRRLLEALTAQIGAAAHAVRLAGDLQHSRERLVAAREEERRRLRRDLHDGLGPALASLTYKLDAARNLLRRDPDATDALLAELKAQTQAAIADIRRVVYDLRPPALDELGLVSALREHAARTLAPGLGQSDTPALQVTVEAPERLPPLPAAIEVAAYRIAIEALNNTIRHAAAHICVIRLALDDALRLEIRDDGVGLPDPPPIGVGLASIRERAAELGGTCRIAALPNGGTQVLVRLPLPPTGEDA